MLCKEEVILELFKSLSIDRKKALIEELKKLLDVQTVEIAGLEFEV